MRPSRALLIFAKKPVPGGVKTRLSPPLTPEESSELYSCMLLDTLNKTMLLPCITPLIFFQADPGAAEYFQKKTAEIEALPQLGINLGERMKNAFARIFARGYAEVAIIGSDSPDLPAAHILQAFDLMESEQTDGVFGPAEDGGYYLIALKRVWPELFDDITWSSPEVLQVSLQRASEAFIRIALLPQWHDVDTFADLSRPELLDAGNSAALTRAFIEKSGSRLVR